jgi:hypothetical protein
MRSFLLSNLRSQIETGNSQILIGISFCDSGFGTRSTNVMMKIVRGERPPTNVAALEKLPAVQSLLETCWSVDLVARPSAARICDELRSLVRIV